MSAVARRTKNICSLLDFFLARLESGFLFSFGLLFLVYFKDEKSLCLDHVDWIPCSRGFAFFPFPFLFFFSSFFLTYSLRLTLHPVHTMPYHIIPYLPSQPYKKFLLKRRAFFLFRFVFSIDTSFLFGGLKKGFFFLICSISGGFGGVAVCVLLDYLGTYLRCISQPLVLLFCTVPPPRFTVL